MPTKKTITEINTEVIAEPATISRESASTPLQKIVSLVVRYPTFALCAVLFVLLFVMSVLYATKGDRTVVSVPDDLASLSVEDQDEVTGEVLKALSEVMILPDDSSPIVASVTDAQTLRGQQAFYAKAENGDVLVVFQVSRQAVIYRPSEHKVVNAGPLIVDENVQ